MKRKQGPTSASFSQAKRIKPISGPTEAVLALQELFDFSKTKTEEDIERRFNHIATTLLHECHLVVIVVDAADAVTKEIEFEILEAEFYLRIVGCHEDPFTHGSEEQKISGKWCENMFHDGTLTFCYNHEKINRYFHRAPRKSADSHCSATSLTGYRGGSRKGLDVTIGGTPSPPVLSKHFAPTTPLHPDLVQDHQLLRGGILLRSLRQLGPNTKVISGPSLLVDHILSLSGASSIADLVENKWAGDTDAFTIPGKDERSTSRMFLRPLVSPPPSSSTPSSNGQSVSSPKIYFSPRIGLDLSHPGTTNASILPLHPRIQFLSKSYRFFTHPEELVANGRPQTFLGVLFSCISSEADFTEALKQPRLNQEIAALIALKESTSARYLAEYIAGREGGVNLLNSFVGPKGKGASSSPSSYLRMMGALSNLTFLS